MQPLGVRIAGVGKYLPERIVTNAELEEKLKLPQGWIAGRTGVLERRYASHETTVLQAAEASKCALKHAGLSLNDIDAVIGASSVPQQAIPCTAALLQRELGMPDGQSACFDINATCLGFLFALHTAAQLLSAGFYKRILIFSSEIASPSLNPKEPESMCLFGDGAAAVILEPSRESFILGASFKTYSSGAHHTQILAGGTLHRPNLTPLESEHNLFHMDGPAVFKQAARTMKPFMDTLLTCIPWDYQNIDYFIPHQASGHAVKSISQHMGFSEKQTVYHLPFRGNCVAASIPLALTEAVEDGQVQRGHKLVLAGTAAGLTLGAVALSF